MHSPIVLAADAAADPAATISWLATRHDADIVCVVLDVDGDRNGRDLHHHIVASGAVRCHVLDVADLYVRDFVLPSLRACALDVHRETESALRDALMTRSVVETARIERSTRAALSTAVSNRSRINALARSLDPELTVLHLPPFPMAPGAERSAAAVALVQAAAVEIHFERGYPVALNGIPMTGLELIDTLSTIARDHGFAHGSYAARLVPLQVAYRHLQNSPMPSECAQQIEQLAVEYAELIATGGWFDPRRAELDGQVAHLHERLNGSVRLELGDGTCRATSVSVAEPAA